MEKWKKWKMVTNDSNDGTDLDMFKIVFSKVNYGPCWIGKMMVMMIVAMVTSIGTLQG